MSSMTELWSEEMAERKRQRERVSPQGLGLAVMTYGAELQSASLHGVFTSISARPL